MQRKSCVQATAVLAVLTIALVLVPGAWAAGKEKVVYSFVGGKDGDGPAGSPAVDSAGNIFGVTVYGGTYGNGTVFKLTRSGKGWKEAVLHTFGGTGDGSLPHASLTFDGTGNIYGTTEAGGIVAGGCSPYGCGTIFRLAPVAGGKWRETILHRFNWNKGDGAQPVASIVLDAAGNVYGTTISGRTGACDGNCGTVFEITPVKDRWTERIICSFEGADGKYVASNLTFDASGNLYGVTAEGGLYGNGVVFELSPSGSNWTETVLYNFRGSPEDGALPDGGLIFDKAGNLYGTTEAGGAHSCGCCGCGTAFRLTSGQNGQWSESILHDFTGKADGRYPSSPLLFDKAGNLYGSASGDKTQAGDVFELMPHSGTWKVRTLYSFKGGTDGQFPGPVISDGHGKLVGVAALGGDLNCGEGSGCGVVFEVTP
jgi:uncharacterized repeat protein (TIGR03803 family)